MPPADDDICQLCGTYHPDEPLICELAYAKMTSPKPLLPNGTRVRIICPGLPTHIARTGTIVEHRPQNKGYMVLPDGHPRPGGFGYRELEPLPESTKTRWDRILDDEL